MALEIPSAPPLPRRRPPARPRRLRRELARLAPAKSAPTRKPRPRPGQRRIQILAAVVVLLGHAALGVFMALNLPGPNYLAPPDESILIDIAPRAIAAPPAAKTPPKPAPATKTPSPTEPRPALQPRAAATPSPNAEPLPIPAPSRSPPQPAAAAAPPAPTPAPARSGPTAADFEGRLMAHLQAYKRYPTASRARREEGVARVRFTLLASGRAENIVLAQSSGRRDLDREALDTVRRAQPLPKLPPELGERADFRVAIDFALR